eukprot:CAMPEP_0172605644 /NCGR_PEP_ID=MMETSP1068-20121228/25881_1 /TAXON_ID=35684 /ORGANISM="Pseudopedinella elastica, Strain CCMP716" /LENGTH=338 /DNA_ID=CAMNT_0013408105 /DNA_START=263 /DNA_END=1279 /DNA_ORIENTATION=-
MSIGLYEGPLAGAIRKSPVEVSICTALNGELVGGAPGGAFGGRCSPLEGDGEREVASIDLAEHQGLGHGMHAFEVWLTNRDGLSLFPENATTVFSSAQPSALHMPDSMNIFLAQCRHERAASAWVSAPDLATGEGLPMARGVLHIGANVAHEAAAYADCVAGGGANVLFVECDREVAKACAANARKYGQRCLQACLSDQNSEGVEFFQSGANGGMSSSLRQFEHHRSIFPGVEHSESSRVRTWRLEDLVASLPPGLLPEMNVVTIDAQGMEFEILSGMGALLDGFDVAVVEVSHLHVYAGQHLGTEVDALMHARGFECAAHCEPCDHCDRLFLRPKGR